MPEQLDISETPIREYESSERKNIIEYKAMAFLADQTKTTFNYEVKRVRALWDPTLSIPGTDRRGGWRCPTGTRYGGQITDRFGRNCGWGVARRIANAITNIGERMENIDDRRRGRRVERRNRRMLERLQNAERGGRLEGAARRIAERLEGDGEITPEAPTRRPDAGDEIVYGRPERIFGPNGPLRIGPVRRRPRQQEQVVEETEETATPPRRPGGRLRTSERRRMEREIQEPGAPRTGEEADAPEAESAPARPRRPRQPQRPRQPRRRGEAVEPREQAGDAPRPNESYEDYINRKYGEYQARVEDIRRRGGRAGLLTREEWYGFNRDNLREAWGRANGGEVPNEGNLAPQQPARPPRAPRRRRVQASEARAQEAASRRPTANDEPVPQGKVPNNRKRKKPAAQPAQPAAQEQETPDLGGRSMPDARSERNIFNRFGQDGLPETAYWRDPAYNNSDKAELERRFGHYYDNNNQRTPRGDLAHRQMQENYAGRERPRGRRRPNRPQGEQRRQPRQAPPEPPAAQPQAAPPQPPSSRTTPSSRQPMNRLKDRHETNLPRLVAEGAKFDEVPRGNKGINTEADAKAYNGSIADVPDQFLDVAVKERSADKNNLAMAMFGKNVNSLTPAESRQLEDLRGRIKSVRTGRLDANNQPIELTAADKRVLKTLRDSGKTFFSFNAGTGGANPSLHLYIAADGNIDGRGYLLKPPDRQFGIGSQHAELMGAELARRMGFAQGQGRIIPKGNNSSWILVELGPNFAEGKAEEVGKFPNRANAVAPGDKESRLGAYLLNGILGGVDRHGGNGMIFRGNGAMPIDFGRGFYYNNDTPQKMVQYIRNEYAGIDGAPLSGYSERYNALTRSGRTPAQAQAEIREELRQTLSRWTASMQQAFDDGTMDALQQRIPNGGTQRIMPVRDRNAAVQRRIAMVGSDAMVDALMDVIVPPPAAPRAPRPRV